MELIEFFEDIPYVLIKVELTVDGANRFIKKHDSQGYRLLVKEVPHLQQISLFYIYEESPLGYY